MKDFVQGNKRTILILVSVLLGCLVIIGGYKAYRYHQRVEAIKAVEKACNSTGPLQDVFRYYEIVGVNVHKKVVDFQMNEELTNSLKANEKAYVEDHVSVASRILRATGEHSDYQGNIITTGEMVQPICYAIASNKDFVKKYGKGWTVNVFDAQGNRLYVYRDDKFLDKPEIRLESAIEKGKQEHDENAAEITEGVLDAISDF